MFWVSIIGRAETLAFMVEMEKKKLTLEEFAAEMSQSRPAPEETIESLRRAFAYYSDKRET